MIFCPNPYASVVFTVTEGITFTIVKMLLLAIVPRDWIPFFVISVPVYSLSSILLVGWVMFLVMVTSLISVSFSCDVVRVFYVWR